MTLKRIACVGVGQRFESFYFPILTRDYADAWEIVGLCDNNPGRLAMAVGWLRELGREVRSYADGAFDQMLLATKPDAVLVTTRDCTHDHYICRAMELGCDVITEKPMTTDEVKCQRIIDTQKMTGRTCTVTFNYRYSPPRTQVKELLMSGVIGNIVSVDFHWLLDTRHGADYFRRWHRQRVNSGGLQVHKATHHFDLVNWWLSTVPERVYATGGRNFYRPEMAQRYGLRNRGERCLDCPEASACPFYEDMRQYPALARMFLENERYDGYIRDACVFGSSIDIEDTLHVAVDYASGASMSYSLHAFMPWEGYTVSFNGTKGRIEHVCQETVYFSGDGTVPGELVSDGTTLKVFPHFQSGYELEVWQGAGGHGGGDPALAEDLFGASPPKDRYQRAADFRSGAWSILVGVAANHSLKRGHAVRVDELVRDLDVPDYPPMPTPDEPIDPLPLKRSTARYTSEKE
jgi:predicted dehydrogenase